MSSDLRAFNGGSRDGSGRPKTINGWHQVAVRLPEDMARWVWRQRGSTADVLRKLVREAMDRDAASAVDQS